MAGHPALCGAPGRVAARMGCGVPLHLYTGAAGACPLRPLLAAVLPQPPAHHAAVLYPGEQAPRLPPGAAPPDLDIGHGGELGDADGAEKGKGVPNDMRTFKGKKVKR